MDAEAAQGPALDNGADILTESGHDHVSSTVNGNGDSSGNGEGEGDSNELQPPSRSAFDAVDEIEALKLKIAQLEVLTRNASADPDLNKKAAGSGKNENGRPNVASEIEKYKRMEKCLYNHRKEWEVNGGSVEWYMNDNRRTYLPYYDVPYGPWDKEWHVSYHRKYDRPDPFDPSHACGEEHEQEQEHQQEQGQEQSQENRESREKSEEYDEAIDFGYHRDRLRKNFEWEMDRLYLTEESIRRKRERERERREKAEEELAKQNAQDQEVEGEKEEADETTQGDPITSSAREEEEIIDYSYAEPKIMRLNWLDFKRFANVTLAERDMWAIHVLVGEPAVDNFFAGESTYWYGYQPRQVRKPDRAKANKATQEAESGQLELAERIRINSSIIIKILVKILGSSGEALSEQADGSVIFTRPFKALTFCEQALRDWHAALDKKHNATPETGKELPPPPVPDASPLAQDENDIKDVETSHDAHVGPPPVEPLSPSTEPVALGEATTDAKDEQGKSTEAKEGEEEKDDPSDITKSPVALSHLKCILDFIDLDMSSRKTSVANTQPHKVFFSDLWHHYQPGTEVIGNDGKQAYRILSVTSPAHRAEDKRFRWNNKSTNTKDTSFTMGCVYIDFDGSYLGPVSKTFVIKAFEGEKTLTSFEVYPLRFHSLKRSAFGNLPRKHIDELPENEKTRNMLINRGREFLRVIQTRHMYYSGPTLVEREEIDSQVVIDFETAFSAEATKKHDWKPTVESVLDNLLDSSSEEANDGDKDAKCYGGCCRGESIFDDRFIDRKQATKYLDSLLPDAHSKYDQPSVAVFPRLLKEIQQEKGGEVPSNEELVIMSYRVFGFVLRSRKWAVLDLSYLSDIHPPADLVRTVDNQGANNQNGEKIPVTAFDRLVLEDGHRNMIISLISQHFRDKDLAHSQSQEFDIIKGKGKGLILLLHGAPGVGKTSTAEGVAELFQKPLLQITCGDLGTTAKEVETALETNFEMASRWGCILLLDEADIFLAERTREDYVRNGLVAVFLRILEYYNGILFLTTNRVGDFDEAFSSRIHISLYYPELSRDKTVKVFQLNLEMIGTRMREKGKRVKIDELEIIIFARDHYTEHEHARWNGRQIRNACQTALALAEFDAQGNNHRAVQNPDALIKLNKEHFVIVQKAYLEFAKYMDDVYGTTSRRRAREAKLRAIRDQELAMHANNFAGMPMNKGMAFMSGLQGQQVGAARAPTQGQPGVYQQNMNMQYQRDLPQQGQPQASNYQMYNQQASAHPQQENFGTQQQYSSNSSQYQIQGQTQHQIPSVTSWNNQPPMSSAAGEGYNHQAQPRSMQSPYPQQGQQPQQQQQQQQQAANLLQQGVEEMYVSGGGQNNFRPPNHFDGARDNYQSNNRD